MSGGALAAGHYLINSTAQINPKVVKKLKGNRGAKGNSGPAGPQGVAGTAGKNGANGATGKTGEAGAAGTALAYADFNSIGEIQETTAHLNLSAANVDHVATGIYCFKNLSFVPNTALVSADNSFEANETVASVRVAPVLADCNPGETVRVRTVVSKTGALTNEPFTIWFD